MTPYWLCALFTAISAFVSLGYSIAALRDTCSDRGTEARYAFVRSAGLAILALVPIFDERDDWLAAVATVMILVQFGDAIVGATIRDRIKTFGPAATSLINLGLLVWFITS